MEHIHASRNEANMKSVATVFSSLNVNDDNKENEEKHQKTSATKKKWYEGVVIKPVAFRSTTKRNFYEN